MVIFSVGGVKILPLSYSFGVESDVTKAQKSVFGHFNLPLNQEIEKGIYEYWKS